MFVFSKKVISNVAKFDLRFFASMKKYKKPIVTQDEQIISDDEQLDLKETVPTFKRGTDFFEFYSDKSIEKLYENDERLGGTVLQSRSLSNLNTDSLVLEGTNMIRDAIKLKAEMTHMYFTKRELLQEIPLNSSNIKAKVYYIPYKVMKKYSNLDSSPGIMAIFKRPNPQNLLVDPFLCRKMPVTLILDNVRDPGNLGTVIRTAAGFNLERIFMTKGCVDLYNSKVLRGSMSSIFCIPIFQNLIWDEIQTILRPNCVVHYADMLNDNGESYPYFDENLVDFKKENSYALVIGGENNGISNEAKRLCETTYGCKMHIPISDSVNSLSITVAASIIMAEFQKRFLTNKK